MPRSRVQLFGIWVATAVVLGGLLAASHAGYSGLDSGLDDPNQGYQRPGLLDVGSLPDHPPAVTSSIPHRGRRAVIFFTREPGVGPLERVFGGATDLRRRADVAVVAAVALVDDTLVAPARAGGVPVVSDPRGVLAHGYGMRTPRDGGPPVGYAIVDRSGRVRYATIDPGAAVRLREVLIMLGAVP